MAAKLSRRQFFRLGLGEWGALLGREEKWQTRFRPPGVLDEEEFLQTCERCHQCAEACPFGVIEILGPGAGDAEETPVLDPERNPCRWCESMDCVRACPSGALSLGANGQPRPIGRATLDHDACLNAQGVLCDECVTVCPSEVGAMKMVGRYPRLDEDACVGCGLCAYHCEATPTAISITPFAAIVSRREIK
ncbi:MAG TPA: 4Fe-4S dicluster domain-containing protein [Candidatus Latescibacteria bacterium]|nr:4Fe-4S dicluster domain-containing protein [Candidatus Handelsmanbacteria bacterium]HIL09860.1 4Fe-4S dicluster domain-containing protein [Candidatus Latescibacterota bacterium]